MNTIDQIVADIQAHLQSAKVVQLEEGESFRLPVAPIRCGDGTEFSIQASEFTYCTPRNNKGPWTAVEVMTLTDGVTPTHWTHDAGDNLAGYVSIRAVAQEIYDRQLTSGGPAVKLLT